MRAIASCLPLVLLLSGCARKLPGPEECRAFALLSLGIRPGTSAALIASTDPRLDARAEDLTRQCLTTPWDYQLMQCLSEGGSPRLCRSRFEARQLGQ
jgi:hypothetical protein